MTTSIVPIPTHVGLRKVVLDSSDLPWGLVRGRNGTYELLMIDYTEFDPQGSYNITTDLPTTSAGTFSDDANSSGIDAIIAYVDANPNTTIPV